jgi:hypothetical protein
MIKMTALESFCSVRTVTFSHRSLHWSLSAQHVLLRSPTAPRLSFINHTKRHVFREGCRVIVTSSKYILVTEVPLNDNRQFLTLFKVYFLFVQIFFFNFLSESLDTELMLPFQVSGSSGHRQR